MAIAPLGVFWCGDDFCCRMHFCNKDILIWVIIDFLGPVMTLGKDLINTLIHYLLLLVAHECC